MNEELLQAYRQLHRKEGRFPGYTLSRYVDEIAALVAAAEPRTLLDWGCGKGWQYSKRRLHDAWGGILPELYDPGVAAHSTRPRRKFDGVITTDVLEHIEAADVPEALAELIGYLGPRDDGGKNMLFASIACRPSKKNPLPDGRNAHVTIMAPEWWIRTVMDAAVRGFHRRNPLMLRLAFDVGETYPDSLTRYCYEIPCT